MTKKDVVFRTRQGVRWIVQHYDPDVRTWRESEPMSYTLACQCVREIRDSWDTKSQGYFVGGIKEIEHEL